MTPNNTFATDLGVLESGLPVVHLTDSEVQFARNTLSKRRNESYVDGSDYSNGGTNYTHDSETTHYLGALGELALAKWHGVDVDDGVYVGGDAGDDLVINNERVDVKCRTNSPPWMYAKAQKVESDDAPDRYYLTEYIDDNHIRLWGSIARDELLDSEKVTSDHPCFHTTNYVLEMPSRNDVEVNTSLRHPEFEAPADYVHYCHHEVCNASTMLTEASLDLCSI